MTLPTQRNADGGTSALSQSIVQRTNDTAAELHAQAGKALAMWLYNIGAASLNETSAKFYRRPSWRSA
jgi:hypothetical protein